MNAAKRLAGKRAAGIHAATFVELSPVALGIGDKPAFVILPVLARGIKALQSEPRRIDVAMTSVTTLAVAVLAELFPALVANKSADWDKPLNVHIKGIV